MNKCLYQFGLDSDEDPDNFDLLKPPTRYLVFEIVHGESSTEFEEHEILSIQFVPEDCGKDELRDAIEDYYQSYFTGETLMIQQAIQRLIK